MARRRRNAPGSLSRADYPAVFGDIDADALPDVDDPRPIIPGDTRSIEEVRLSDEIGHLIDARDEFMPAMQTVMDRLSDLGIRGAKVQGRVKTPYSIINKLRRKRLGTLTDVAGTRIVLPDRAGLDRATAAIEEDFEILEKLDYYETPQAGYRAVHYIIRVNGKPVEVQVKTRRMAAISGASHTPYKRGALDEASMDRLTSLAAAADEGDRSAAREIDRLLKDKRALERALTVQNPRLTRASYRLANVC